MNKNPKQYLLNIPRIAYIVMICFSIIALFLAMAPLVGLHRFGQQCLEAMRADDPYWALLVGQCAVTLLGTILLAIPSGICLWITISMSYDNVRIRRLRISISGIYLSSTDRKEPHGFGWSEVVGVFSRDPGILKGKENALERLLRRLPKSSKIAIIDLANAVQANESFDDHVQHLVDSNILRSA